MNNHSVNLKSNRLANFALRLIFLVVFFLFFLWISIQTCPDGVELKKCIYLKLLDSILSSLATIICFNLLYEWLMRNDGIREIQNAILSSTNIINKLNKNELEQITLTCLSAIYGEEKGRIFYNDLIRPFTYDHVYFRKKYNYSVSIDEFNQPDSDISKLLMNKSDNYYSIGQVISYYKNVYSKNMGIIKVGIVFDDKTLHEWMNDGIFFFRETLVMSPDDLKEVINAFKSEKLDGIKFFDISFSYSEYQYQSQSKIINIDNTYIKISFKEAGFLVTVDLNSIENFDFNRLEKIYFGFKHPHLKNYKRFICSIPEPTENPTITFTHSSSIQKLNHFLFTTGKDKYINPIVKINNSYVYNSENWIFSDSGIIFFWE